MARIAAGAAAVLLALLVAAPAWAHTGLFLSYPGQGDSLDAVPDEVSISFYSTVEQPAEVEVIAPDGADLAEGDAVVRNYLLTQRLRPSDQVGTYEMTYSAMSPDGHLMTDTITFTVGSVNTLAALKASRGESPAQEAGGIPGLLVALGALGASGVVFALVRRARTRT